jgi:predicted Abi (CAAX) family protease
MATSDFWQQCWQLAGGALRLQPETFLALEASPRELWVAITVILLAGLSQAIGQSIVLFVNQVKPLRFGLSLIMSSLIYLATYVFWAISIWLVVNFVFGLDFRLLAISQALALCYAPQLLEFLVALPYFGMPISVLLSIWTLLAILVGVATVTSLSTWQVVVCVGLGWLVLQLGQRTIGRPLTILARWLRSQSAGQPLITQNDEIRALLEDAEQPLTGRRNDRWKEEIALPERPLPTNRNLYRGLAIALVIFFVASAIATSQPGLSAWFAALNRTTRLVLNLGWVSLLALGVAVLLTPFESLSWWAGWQGERPLNPGESLRPLNSETQVSRFVTYLDGINQGTYGYLPIVETFLDRLAHSSPPDILIVKGIIPYSISNNPLTANNPFAFLWRVVDSFKATVPRFPIGFIINVRNLYAVMVSADARYGPIQNRGLAQVLYDSLRYHGYEPGSGVPITLLGFSGGGQMSMGAVPYLQAATGAPIEVISLSGVMSGNTGAMQANRLYYLSGDRDLVEKLGALLFPARWPIALLSSWNKAKRRGRMVFVPLGPVGHAGQRGPLGEQLDLADGRSHLQQTIDVITGILCQDWDRTGLERSIFVKPSNYELYQAAPFNRVSYYPVVQSMESNGYQPLSDWLGRLILPDEGDRHTDSHVLIELYHAPPKYDALVGRVLPLQWSHHADVQAYVKLVTMDVNFAEQVQLSRRRGVVHPDRLNHWPHVDPLESIAGAHPWDDVIVGLPTPIAVVGAAGGNPTLMIHADPIHLTGRYYALVQIVAPTGDDRFRVRHYDRATQQFAGPEEIVYVPTVVPNRNGVLQSSNQGLERSPHNQQGWYIFGAQNHAGEFVVQALTPYSLLAPEADQVLLGMTDTVRYISREYWRDTAEQTGKITRTLLLPNAPSSSVASEEFASHWQVGDRALLLEVYGGIGGNKKEFAPLGIYFGHFSFGLAHVIAEPLTGLPRFDIEYRQIFTHSPEGVVAGSNHWTRFMGDRQFGRLGFRPVSDILIKFPPFTDDYDFDGVTFSPMNRLIRELDVMAARYRVGDGTGTTFVSPINSCVQDSTQALLTALKRLLAEFELNPLMVKWLREHPDHEQTQRFRQLQDLLRSLDANLNPLWFTRSDWRTGELTLGSFAGEQPLDTLIKTAASWRSLFPRLANDVITLIFLQLGAMVWVIRANQIGGEDPDILPIAPTDFSLRVPKVKRAKPHY